MIAPLRAAALAKRLRTQARTARLAGDYDHAQRLNAMAATAQQAAVTTCFQDAA